MVLWLLVQSLVVVVAAVVLLLVVLFHTGKRLALSKQPPRTTAHMAPRSSERAPFLELSALELAARIRTRQLSSVEAVHGFFDQLLRANLHTNAICSTRRDEALAEARVADQQLAECYAAPPEQLAARLAALPPFHGVPCMIKESISVAGQSWTSGLVSVAGRRADADAVTVQRLRHGGLIPLGVSNVPELCMWYETYNNIYGRTYNPYDLTRTVGGSSGGEAAAIATCSAPCGLGSDVGGSIRMPAFFNGVFGHKPTGGVVPCTGQFPVVTAEVLQRYLTTGPIARHACDLWPMLRLLAGPDGVDKACTERSPALEHEPAQVELATLQVVVIKDLEHLSPPLVSALQPELIAAYRRTVEHLRSRGCHIREIETLRYFDRSPDIWIAMVALSGGSSFKSKLCNGQRQDLNLSLELLKWGVGASDFTLPALLYALVDQLPGLTPARTAALARDGDAMRRYVIDEVLHINTAAAAGARISNTVLLFPPHPTTAPKHDWPLLRIYNWLYTGIWNVLELPATQVPLGLDTQGLPLGIQVVGLPHHDHVTIAVAEELERAFGGWVRPPHM